MSKALNSVKSLIKGLVLHWSAGRYDELHDAYHFCITWDGKKAKVVQTRSVLQIGTHTWKRNTGRIGIAFCSENWTLNPICLTQPDQVEKMAKLVAELSIKLNLNILGSHSDFTLVSRRPVQIPNVTDHVFYAKLDVYGKVDIGKHLAPVLKKAAWYRAQLEAGKIKFEYVDQVF